MTFSPAPGVRTGHQDLRVLFLVSRDFKNPGVAGGDLQVWDWARYLAAQGHEATIVCIKQKGLPAQETIDGVRIIRLGTGFILPAKALLYYWRNRGTIDIVYDDVIGGGRPPFLAPLYVRKPILASWHQVNSTLFQDTFPRPIAFALTMMERALALMYRGPLVRAPSEETRSELNRRLGLPLAHVHVVPASIPDHWFRPLQTGRREPLIVWIGKYRPYKYAEHLLEAMPQVLAAVPCARLVMAGRHDSRAYEQSLAQRIEALGLAGKVEMRFEIPDQEKYDLLSSARVLALPSHLEGFGIVVLEANARGAPVVASSGVPESAVRDGYNGLRYQFGDVKALAERLVQVLTDDALHARLSTNGRAFAEQFSWASVGARFEALLKLTIEQKAARKQRPPHKNGD